MSQVFNANQSDPTRTANYPFWSGLVSTRTSPFATFMLYHCMQACNCKLFKKPSKSGCSFDVVIWINRYHVPRSWLQPTDNLLVLFEETGGNPFKISIKTVSIETVCAHVSEDYYPPVQTWSRSNGELITSQKNPVVQLQCEDGYTIASIDFASYGTPQGSCQTYSTGKCHASTSASILSKVS